MHIPDLGRVPGEEGLDVARLSRRDDEVDPSPRNVDPGQLTCNLLHLCHNYALFEPRSLHDGGRILRVGACVEVAVLVRQDTDYQGDLRCEIEKIAGEKLEVGMNLPDLHLRFIHKPCYLRSLGTGK